MNSSNEENFMNATLPSDDTDCLTWRDTPYYYPLVTIAYPSILGGEEDVEFDLFGKFIDHFWNEGYGNITFMTIGYYLEITQDMYEFISWNLDYKFIYVKTIDGKKYYYILFGMITKLTVSVRYYW